MGQCALVPVIVRHALTTSDLLPSNLAAVDRARGTLPRRPIRFQMG